MGKQTKTLEIKSWVLTEKMLDYEVFEKGLNQNDEIVLGKVCNTLYS